MSDLLPLFDGDDGSDRGDGSDAGERRRSLITLAVVLVFAMAVTVLAVLVLHSPGHRSGLDHQLADPTEVITVDSTSAGVTQSPAPTSPLSSPTATPSGSTSASTSASSSASR